MINLRRPVTRTSFLDSRFRLRNRANRLLEAGHSVNDSQLDPVAHVGRPGNVDDTTERSGDSA
ncbi:hypothetical protein [Rubrivirga sp.]|uniref:hypothetical protein n=1 Tax=Rubrivirga sp. TaxID=1885344 RepID=UPI003C747659